MNNFARALRLTLRHRWTFAASVVCAIGVSVLWGGSISAIYPFIAVALEGKSLHDWADKSIERSESSIARLRGEQTELEGTLAGQSEPDWQVEKRLGRVERQLAAEERWLAGGAGRATASSFRTYRTTRFRPW